MRIKVSSLEYDSRMVGSNSVFFAIEGHQLDGHRFIPQALFKGAAAIVSERPVPSDFPGVWLQVPKIRRSMAEMANHYYGYPSNHLKLAGVTGTNGKTTTAYLIHSVMQTQGPAVLVGTIQTIVGRQVQESLRTTPEATEIQKALSRAVEQKCRSGVIEVSSHALALDRAYQCSFDVGIFTNLSQDHLDFHESFDHYFASKRRLFDLSYNPGLRTAVLNGDDPRVTECPLHDSVRRVTFGMSKEHEIHPLEINTGIDGTELVLNVEGRRLEISSALAGEHNVYNLMAAVSACLHLGFQDQEIARGIARLERVPGRFERVSIDAPFSVFVDYAHTPDALANVLSLARDLCQRRLICVFGCGGNRDRTKRARMGRIASQQADLVVLTSDNPRSEAPEEIIRQIELGVSASGHCESITDRRQAMERAFELARPGDLVLIAGKGHETCQESGGEKIDFDDVRVAEEIYDHGLLQ